MLMTVGFAVHKLLGYTEDYDGGRSLNQELIS